MRKFIFVVFAFFSLTAVCTPGQPDIKLHEKCLYPTVMIKAVNGPTYGTGCIIRSEKSGNQYKNLFLTCAHLFDPGIEHQVIYFGYQNWSKIVYHEYFDCQIFAKDHDRDLAIGVFYSSEQMPVAQLDMNPTLFIGNELFRIGCGLGSEPRLDNGKVTSVTEELRTSIFTVPGDSGSPVFHEYKIVGVMKWVKIVRAFKDSPALAYNFSFAVPTSEIKDWSEDNEKSLEFIWLPTNKLPILPFLELEMKEYEFKKK